MLLPMMIKMTSTDIIAKAIPRGSLQRFGIAGGLNTVIFWMLWELMLWFFPQHALGVLWACAWAISSCIAHFVHRSLTFDGSMPLKWTLTTSIPVYILSMFGSSATITYLVKISSLHLRILSLVNILVWGFIVWLLMRVVVFQFHPSIISHEPQADPEG